VLAHVLALMKSPLRHIGNFIKIDAFFKIRKLKDIPQAFLDFFLGLLDIIGEVAKLVSISTRLFGNMFAGEVVVGIIAGLMFATQFVIPIPFIALGILAGFVQAFVFALLGTIYLASALQGVERPTEA
jgi:F-type H+-transporting ATPase subunit a